MSTIKPVAGVLHNLPPLPSPEYDRCETASGVRLFSEDQMRDFARKHEVSVTTRLAEPTRKDAEQWYTINAFDYVRDPVGSSKWVTFFEGWSGAVQFMRQAAEDATPQPAVQADPTGAVKALPGASDDEKRLDWLADKNNSIGNVQLPTWCVLKNPDSLRAAIDAAMRSAA